MVGETLIIALLAGGGWWWLTRRRHQPGATDGPVLHGSGASPLGVTGLHHHRQALDTLFAGVRADARDSETAPGDYESTDVAATLVLVDDNPHDTYAVEVRLGGTRIGYLPATMARPFRAHLKAHRLQGSNFRCPATVEVPLDPSDDYSIALDLPQLTTGRRNR